MPVKIRCSGCEKVLNIPDAAMGKTVRCPKCETRIKVPQRRARKPVPQRAQESTEMFLDLDLNEAADRSSRICPSCGISLEMGDELCPQCGVDVLTGQLSQVERKRRSKLGPDSSLYYKDVWVNSWEFVWKNKSLALRTFWYWLLFASVMAGTAFMVDWCSTLPTKITWGSLGVLAFLTFPGWLWTLTLRVVVATAGKKKIDRVNFDPFLNIAFGIKWILWWAAFSLPAVLLALPFLLVSSTAYFVVAGILILPLLMMVPIAMAHMSMPVTWRAWVSPMLAGALFRHLGNAAMWLVVFLITVLICFGPLGGAIAAYGKPLSDAASANKFPPTVAASVVGVCTVVSHLLFSFGALFLMRATGLFSYYNKRTLDLETMVKEKEYVAKSLIDVGEKQIITLEGGLKVIGMITVLGLAGGSLMSVLGGRGVNLMHAYSMALCLAGWLISIWGRFLVSKLAWKESKEWGLAVWLPFVDFVYAAKNFETAKLPMILQYSCIIHYSLAMVLLVLGMPES